MSSKPCGTAEQIDSAGQPDWWAELLGVALPEEGGSCRIGGHRYLMKDGILRGEAATSAAQAQTAETFGFKWHKRDTFESQEQLQRMREWLVERYGDVVTEPWFAACGPAPLLLDAGCGGAMSAIELFSAALDRLRYVGVDVSSAVEVARARFLERGWRAAFMQSDLMALPFPEASFDLIFSEGVLHHTDSTEAAFLALAPLLKPGGRLLFYVYRKKGPVREFTDDHIRDQLQAMSPQEAWDAVMPLTRLGKILGDLDIEVDIPDPIDLLSIPAGPIKLQRLFYWHVFKAFYRPELSLEEMNHINYDWYAPRNAHRHGIEEVRRWCAAAGLDVERERVEDAGITIIARRRAQA